MSEENFLSFDYVHILCDDIPALRCPPGALHCSVYHRDIFQSSPISLHRILGQLMFLFSPPHCPATYAMRVGISQFGYE